MWPKNAKGSRPLEVSLLSDSTRDRAIQCALRYIVGSHFPRFLRNGLSPAQHVPQSVLPRSPAPGDLCSAAAHTVFLAEISTYSVPM
jgi:hypothetical protein